jgi:hypothetical protein
MTHEKLFVEKAKQLFPIMFEGRTADECWVWGGRITWSVKVNGKILSTVLRRIAYAAFNGDIPPYHEVKTTCEHTGCVNPRHLTTRISLRQITKRIEDGSLLPVTCEGVESAHGVTEGVLFTQDTAI